MDMAFYDSKALAAVKYYRILLIVFIILMQVAGPATAADVNVSEYQVKAAFLYNFAKFVNWPDRGVPFRSQNFVIGILGRDPFGEDIRIIEDKSIKGKTLKVIRGDELDKPQNCHLLFISASAESRLSGILEKLRGQPVLTVGDTPGFARAGVMINLFKMGNKIRFEINPVATEQAGLKISAHLLRLARIVEQGMVQGANE